MVAKTEKGMAALLVYCVVVSMVSKKVHCKVAKSACPLVAWMVVKWVVSMGTPSDPKLADESATWRADQLDLLGC